LQVKNKISQVFGAAAVVVGEMRRVLAGIKFSCGRLNAAWLVTGCDAECFFFYFCSMVVVCSKNQL
jgi:hypothetical protein